MDRRDAITKYITKDMRGLEVGPWFAPLAAKKGGYNCLSVDVFDADALRERARNDSNISDEVLSNIEEVDLLGTSTEIASLIEARGEIGTYDYIISSHNFEHLPNPVKFLQGCSRVLKVNGMLSMAIPDKRTCFDYFRPHSTIAQVIDAYFEDRRRPTLAQMFDQSSLHSRYRRGAEMHTGFTLQDDPAGIMALRTLKEGYSDWARRRESVDNSYNDTHCWIFTPATFELVVRDLAFLSLSQFEIVELDLSGVGEFFVHMKNVGGPVGAESDRFYEERDALLQRVGCELAENTLVLRLTRANAELEARALQEQIAERDREIAQLKKAEEEIKNSTSWRLTEPMRQIVEAARAVGAACRMTKKS